MNLSKCFAISHLASYSRWPSAVGQQTLLSPLGTNGNKAVAVGLIVCLTAVYYLVGDYLELPGLAQAEFEQAVADAVLLWER